MLASVIVTIVIIAVVAGLIVAGIIFAKQIGEFFQSFDPFPAPEPTKQRGESCTESHECIGYELGKTGEGAVVCCGDCKTGKKTCEQLVEDYAGNWYCRNEAVMTYGTVPTCKRTFKDYENGSWEHGFWRCEQEDGSVIDGTDCCREPSECKGFTAVGPGTTCCEGRCVQKKKDALGTYWCPQIVDAAAQSTAEFEKTASNVAKTLTGRDDGTANVGENCTVHEDCKGWGPTAGKTACCRGKCMKKTALNFCPAAQKGERCDFVADCAAGLACRDGTCQTALASNGSTCALPTDCASGICCRRKCASSCPPAKENETCYLFADCEAGLECRNGSCQKPRPIIPPSTEECVIDSDCPGWTAFGQVACCKNKCVTKTGPFCP